MSASRSIPMGLDHHLIDDALLLERLDKHLYLAPCANLWKPSNGRGAFGGQVIGQAAWAGVLSLRDDEDNTEKTLHSLHSYFLSFGNVTIPIIYHVERLRFGRSYSTYQVTAKQNGIPIFLLACSFALPEPKQPSHEFPLPGFPLSLNVRTGGQGKIPEPEECPPTEERLQAILDRVKQLPRKLRDYIERNASERRQSSIEVRNTDKTDLGVVVSDKGSSPQQLYWFRSRAPIRRDPDFHKCVLSYASDLNFIGTAARANGLGSRTKPSLGMLASLDHSMHFYDNDVDASDWMLFYMESPVVKSGRGLVHGRIYTRDGRLAVICNQEGVVRASMASL